MFPCQGDADPDEKTDQKTDDETKSGRVTHRAFTEIKNPRRFIFVHAGILNRPGQSASKGLDKIFSLAFASERTSSRGWRSTPRDLSSALALPK
jgi:hypothetical protein